MIPNGLSVFHFVMLSLVLFSIGMAGIMINRKSVISILMSIEIMMLAVNINFVAFAGYLGDISGQIFVLMVLTVAAAEVAIGLAILVLYFRRRGTIEVSDASNMRG
jgi:NADH-quinone oxidoreductase subunit K